MPEKDPHKRRRVRNAKQNRKESAPRQNRTGLFMAIAAGTSLGAFVGLLTGYLLTPRCRKVSGREPQQILLAWQEMARKLSEQLQMNGAG